MIGYAIAGYLEVVSVFFDADVAAVCVDTGDRAITVPLVLSYTGKIK